MTVQHKVLPNDPQVLSILHEQQKKDRSVFDKGQRAFVSHMRAYTKHECNLLLQFKELPLGHIATSYGLLRLPIMPEIKEEHREQFCGPKENIDFNSIPYKDKQKETSRLQKLEEYRKSGVWPSKKKKKMVRFFAFFLFFIVVRQKHKLYIHKSFDFCYNVENLMLGTW